MRKSLFTHTAKFMWCCTILACLLGEANAQTQTAYSPYSLLDTVIDNLGNRFSIGEIAIDDGLRYEARLRAGDSTATFAALIPSTCSSGYFQLYYDSSWGGGTAEQAVICQVLQDISKLIISPCSSTGQKINIWVRNIAALTSSTGAAGAATSFYNLPSSTSISGIADNTIWITANSGKDAYTNVVSPVYTSTGSSSGGTFFHGMMAFNFSSGIPWHTNMSTPPGTGGLDFYTVVLHEMLHALGFASLIEYNGGSRLGGSFKYFSRYDTRLKSSGGAPLITHSGCSMYNYGFNPGLYAPSILSSAGTSACPAGYLTTGVSYDSTACPNAVKYVGGFTVPVYTPGCFERGSSLSHFEDRCYASFPSGWPLSATASVVNNNQYFLMANKAVAGPYSSGNPGAMKRHPGIEERQALCEIGYCVDSIFSDTSTAYYNYFSYGSSVCGTQVAGINDGLTTTGSYAFSVATGSSIRINGGSAGSLLTNDYGVSGAGSRITCLEVITGGGSVSAAVGYDTTTLIYTPGTADYGVQLLRYVPVSATGVIGNITYVYVYVRSTGCSAATCDFISNPGFDVGRGCGLLSPSSPIDICEWQIWFGSPDYFTNGCTAVVSGYTTSVPLPRAQEATASDVYDHLGGTSSFIGLWGDQQPRTGGNFGGEGVQTKLAAPMISGVSYKITGWAMVSHNPSKLYHDVELGFYMDTMPLIVKSYLPRWTRDTLAIYDSIGHTTIHTTAAGGVWQPFSLRFTCPPGYSDTTTAYLGMLNARNYSTAGVTAREDYVFVDHVQLNYDTILVTGTHAVICAGDTSVLTAIGGKPPYTWTPSGGGAAVIARSLSVYPATTTSYTLTDSLGCVTGVYTLTVNPVPASITGPGSLCDSSSFIFTDATTGGSWSSSNIAVVYIDSLGGIATSGVAGTATITYTLSVTGCFTTRSLHVYPNPLPITGASGVCLNGTTPLSEAITGGTWSSSNPSVASIDAIGVVHGRTVGTATITYTLPGGCFVTAAMTVNPLPVLTTSPDQLICGGIGRPLFAAIGGVHATVSGYTYNWSPGTGLSAINIYNPTAAPTATTTYTVTVTNNVTGCFSTDSVTVFVIPGTVCNPCNDFGIAAFSVLGGSGTINASVGAGNYYIPANVRISGNITFTDAVIEIEDGAKIYVNEGSSLQVKGSHLYSCDSGMWDGIVLGNTSDTMGTLELTSNTAGKSTLIEDATTAVTAAAPATPARRSSTAYYLSCNNTIFNRNAIGIAVSGFTSAYSGNPADSFTYPFRIVNTVFTGRDFSLYKISTTPYPYTWPNTTGTYGLKTAYNPSTAEPVRGSYMAPFNIANPYAGPATAGYASGIPYRGKKCHDGTAANIGILAGSIGTGALPFTSLVIGDTAISALLNAELNLFDTLQTGIATTAGNIIVRNCAFMGSYYGINANGSSARHQLAVEPSRSRSTTNTWPNYFYNSTIAVQARCYYRVRGYNSKIITYNNSWASYIWPIGYHVSGRAFDKVDLSTNTITNVHTGMLVQMGSGSDCASTTTPGQVTIDSNWIQAKTSTTSSFPAFVDKAIWVDNPLGGYGAATTNRVNVDYNVLVNPYCGILVSNVTAQVVTSSYNTITLKDSVGYIGASTSTINYQYGIQHIGSFHNECVFNNVSSTNDQNGRLWGILSQNCAYHRVTCNTVSKLGRGIMFASTSLGCDFRGNTMNNCGKGYVLSTAAIGTQGSSSDASANKWTATGGFAWNLGTPLRAQTYTEGGVSPTSSTLIVKSGSITDPVKNDNFYHSWALIYGCNLSTGVVSGSGNGLVITTAPQPMAGCDGPPKIKRGMGLQAASGFAASNFADYPAQHGWMAQFNLWEAMAHDDTLGNSSDTLTTFKTLAANSRYALFTQIEGMLTDGDAVGAQQLLSATGLDDYASMATDSATGIRIVDSATAEVDTIVANYRRYYEIYSQYLQGSLSSADSTALDTLAKSCPITAGAVVYKARALYNVAYNTMRTYIDDCGYDIFATDTSLIDSTYVMDSVETDSSASRQIRDLGSIKYGNGAQQYQLHPNPNNGSFTIRQFERDEEGVSAEIYDAIGRVIYRSAIKFAASEVSLSMENAAPGMYLLKLRDSKGRNFMFKFIVQ